jgi:ABC-type lipoprotein export system ATPase subunit
MIELTDVKKVYDNGLVKTHVLKGVSLNVEAGEFLAIRGPSGSGKSTLMHIMCFLDHITSGVYKFENQTIQDIPDEKLARIRNKRMGFIFQSFNLMNRMTVFDNISFHAPDGEEPHSDTYFGRDLYGQGIMNFADTSRLVTHLDTAYHERING